MAERGEQTSPSAVESPLHDSSDPLLHPTGLSSLEDEQRSPTAVPPPNALQMRVQTYKKALAKRPIDIDLVRSLADEGIPEEHGLRALYWKVLLNYLPTDPTEWDDVLKKNRQLYAEWVESLIVNPHDQEDVSGDGKDAVDVTEEDHPLCQKVTSVWAQHFQDQEMMAEIDKDVKRTFPHLHFFNHDGSEGNTKHYRALRRILFIYAKLNKGICYVQGMNEILGPIYYIFATDADLFYRENAEADAFFCFTNVMMEVRDNFCKSLDHTELGVKASIARLNNLLKEKDYQLWRHLESCEMNPQFYSFRWITLLLSQEFDLPDVMRLWDSLFSDPRRFDFLYYCCCAMLWHVRDELLAGGFADNLKLLQQYPPDIEIASIISTARWLKSHRVTTTSVSASDDTPNSPLQSAKKFLRTSGAF